MKRPEPSARVSLDRLEERLELLRVAYERYFSGVDAIPPVQEHQAVTRSFLELTRNPTSSTVQRFRANTLRQRFSVYQQHWHRVLRGIENGTFTRVVAEAKRRQQEEQRQVRAAQAGASGGGDDARELRRLYEDYVAARKAAGQSLRGVDYDTIAAKLSQQIPALERQHGVKVALEVVNEGGKIRFRARPRR
ncbi:MAG: hypothetical protein B7733_00430 [Myxococcales bacterium FL481]|nr:MAG: hypothetical protein B7733_00430 [Myxococcales bacterium FL481]